jgi:hypothetical protein
MFGFAKFVFFQIFVRDGEACVEELRRLRDVPLGNDIVPLLGL